MYNEDLCKTAVILAGGKSRRAGFDKQQLLIKGMPAAVYIGKILEVIFPEILIISNTPELYTDWDFQVISDTLRNNGPAGGLYSALNYLGKPVFLTACDMPYVSPQFIRFIVNKFSISEIDILSSSDSMNRPEPFNSIYSNTITENLLEFIENGGRALAAFHKTVNTEYLSYNEINKLTNDWEVFTNLNSAEEIKEFLNKNSDITVDNRN